MCRHCVGFTETARIAIAALVGFGLTLLTASAFAQGLRRLCCDGALRGGVTVDAWGATSTLTSDAQGEFIVRIPSGARVHGAWLISGVRNGAANTPIIPPAGGTPRQVILGEGPAVVTRQLQGAPDCPSFTGSAPATRYATWITDVTGAVRATIGTRRGELQIPVRERGDDPTDAGVQIMGHTLVVVYELDTAPLRNVMVYGGCVSGVGGSAVNVASVRLPSPVARCGPGEHGNEAAALSVTLMSDPCDQDNELRLSGMGFGGVVSRWMGGMDDWIGGPSCNGSFTHHGAITAGSFGGDDGTLTRAPGVPRPVDGDSFNDTPTQPRKSAELWDLGPGLLPVGTRDFTLTLVGTGGELVSTVVLQVRAQGDTDDDGFEDNAEGYCAQADRDGDGIPDWRDPDSDNDCVPDRMETSPEARTNPDLPMEPHCAEPTTVCDRATGQCVRVPDDGGLDGGTSPGTSDGGDSDTETADDGTTGIKLRYRGSGCACEAVPGAAGSWSGFVRVVTGMAVAWWLSRRRENRQCMS